MNLSLGEFGALVVKAFRGAGYSWGLTEDAGFAATRLAEFEPGAGAAVVRLLELTTGIETTTLMPTAQWAMVGELLCPVCVGVTMIDAGGCPEVEFDQLGEPLLLAPFLSALSHGSNGYLLEWDGGRCEVGADTITLSGRAPRLGPVSVLHHSNVAPGGLNRSDRVDLDNQTTSALQRFAHRTYAPASEESRLSGAGAGILDQD